MSEHCPCCGADMGEPSPGRLSQSGATHLPANVWICTNCPEPVVVVKPTGAPFRPDPEYLAALAEEREEEARRAPSPSGPSLP